MSNALSVKQQAFLAAYRELGNVTHAARAAEVARRNHPIWMQQPEYAEAFEDAREEACDHLEGEARRRAVTGTEEPVFYNGQVCGTIRKYSDTLLIFLLKAANPEKFNDRRDVRLSGQVAHQHTGQVQVYIPDNGRDDTDDSND